MIQQMARLPTVVNKVATAIQTMAHESPTDSTDAGGWVEDDDDPGVVVWFRAPAAKDSTAVADVLLS